MLQVTRHGKPVATIEPSNAHASVSFANWVVSGKGSVTVVREEALTELMLANFEDIQDVWSPLTAEQHAERQRTKSVASWDQLLGHGRPEDWEGFDEALESWRKEPIQPINNAP